MPVSGGPAYCGCPVGRVLSEGKKKEEEWNDKIDEVRVLIREIEKKYPDMDKIIKFDCLCQDLWVLQKLLQREIKKDIPVSRSGQGDS